MKLKRRNLVAIAVVALAIAYVVFQPVSPHSISVVNTIAYGTTEKQAVSMLGSPTRTDSGAKGSKLLFWIASDGVIVLGFDSQGALSSRQSMEGGRFQLLMWKIFGMPF